MTVDLPRLVVMYVRLVAITVVLPTGMCLNMGLAACLTENPEPTFPQQCGNRHVERGEECDCGSPEVCCHIC